jgi:hypothetical protein
LMRDGDSRSTNAIASQASKKSISAAGVKRRTLG